MNRDIALPDFNVLVTLHQQDPAAFENLRRHLLREAVSYAPLARRPDLENLLDRMEAARKAANTPMEAAQSAFRMMQDSVEQLQNSWEQARYAAAGLQASLIIERSRLH